MENRMFASLFAVLLCVQGVASQTGGTGGTGQECSSSSPPCKEASDVCQNNVCKIRSSQNCAGPMNSQCVMGALCVKEICSCNAPAYKLSESDTVCEPSDTYVGGSCSGTGQADCRDTDAECVNGICTCTQDYVRDGTDNRCKASAAGLNVSLFLLLVGLVTSHFL